MSVFSFSGYLVAVNVCPECKRLHSKQVFRFLRQEPVCYPAYIDRHTKEVVNMLLAVNSSSQLCDKWGYDYALRKCTAMTALP